jgi:hypothetical protein
LAYASSVEFLSVMMRNVLGLAIALGANATAEAATRLYFYPPPYQLSDGSTIASPVTVDARQLTDGFPSIKEMDGVALLVYWSKICPTEAHCDFSLIDRVLSYWKARGKSVVLGVATVGYPIRTIRNGDVTFEGATPNWLLDKISSYKTSSGAIDKQGPPTKVMTRFPVYNDRQFISAVQHLVALLAARYDRNPTVAQVRISTGLLTEDNPSVAGLRSAMPGFNDLVWIKYCRQITDIYLDAFKKTQVEFDVGRISWTIAGRDGNAAQEAQNFYNYLLDRHVFIAFNGLRSDLRPLIESRQQGQPPALAGARRSLQFLLQAKQRHLPVGLEDFGPLSDAHMQNMRAIGDIVCFVRPDRLVFFALTASLQNFERFGRNPANQRMVQAIKPRVPELMKLSNQQLKLANVEQYCGRG